VFLLVLAHPGSLGQRAVKRLLCVVVLSQEDKPQTHSSVHEISRETVFIGAWKIAISAENLNL